MVNIKDLFPGMRVKVVDRWGSGCFPTDDMTRLLGTVVTVKSIEFVGLFGEAVHVEEDGGEWFWTGKCFDHIVDELPEIESANDDEVLSFIFA